MKIEIKRWDNNEIIVCGEYENIRDCLEKNKNKSFYRADLSFANLRSADLNSANLRSADLNSADLNSADLNSADLRFANLNSADLRFANLNSADLRSADLSSANLRSADLRSADLSSANLSFANLSFANLNSADLRSAKNINKYITTPLYAMLDQPGIIRAYKIVNSKNEGIYNGGLIYKVGESVEIKDADTDELKDCGKGINLATLDWCIKEWKKGYKILIAEFTKEDIACIPIGSDGKFRVFRCKIIGEKNLKEIGIND